MPEATAVIFSGTRPAFNTPWEPTAEDHEKEGPYADYTAWERWMEARMERSPNGVGLWDDMSILDRADFYAAMVDACEFTAKEHEKTT